MPQKIASNSDASVEITSLTVNDLISEADDHGVYDLLGIGFGPASLAVAIAIYDILEQRALIGSTSFSPKVRFVERQSTFGWHPGMLLPGTKMQISFIKDLATIRNPQSHFTFLNYLKEHNRLVQFSNLDTFLPLRIEFEDYLKWSAYHFGDFVQYSQEVISVKPLKTNGNKKVDCLEVTSRNLEDGAITVQRGRNVIIAVGGRPSIPVILPQNHDKILHSSEYNYRIESVLPNKDDKYSIAVVGAGQSAAEIFNDLQSRYPNAKTRLLLRDTALRPSDDSPFVNEVFNPEAVDEFYSTDPSLRKAQLKVNKATNYSVVRLNLLERIYEDQYHQRLQDPDPENWQHQILPSREIVKFTDSVNDKQLELTTRTLNGPDEGTIETHSVDAIILATGYIRDVHNKMLEQCKDINAASDGSWEAERDYKVKLNRDLVEDDVQIYLQGCNEQTHGLADTLLSILATRGGEIVDSVFGQAIQEADSRDLVDRRARDGRIVGATWKLYPERKEAAVNGTTRDDSIALSALAQA